MINKYRIRFDELEGQIVKLENKKVEKQDNDDDNTEYLTYRDYLELKTKVRNLIVNTCGVESEHYKAIIASEKTNYSGFLGFFYDLKAIFRSAKEDYLGGYLSSVKSLVQAELFDDELEQAKELFDKGYHVASAVIARVILETWIKELCKENNIETENVKLGKMNEDLGKAGVYNMLLQKQITALAAIGNSAAHGKTNEFTIEQVKNMLMEIRTLLTYNLNG